MRGWGGSLKHILSSCLTVLVDGRYRWRHNQILKEIVEVVNAVICTNTPNYQKKIDKVCQGRSKSQTKGREHSKCTVTGNRLGTNGRFRDTIKIPRPYCPNIIMPRYTNIFE